MEIIKKISEIQKTLKAPKNQYNSFGKYKYRSCEDILEALKPLLHKQGLIQIISDEPVLMGDRNYIKASVLVTDGKATYTATAYAREPLKRAGMDESQITGSASSYARKYALNGMWAIDDTKDADVTQGAPEGPKASSKDVSNRIDTHIKNCTTIDQLTKPAFIESLNAYGNDAQKKAFAEKKDKLQNKAA